MSLLLLLLLLFFSPHIASISFFFFFFFLAVMPVKKKKKKNIQLGLTWGLNVSLDGFPGGLCSFVRLKRVRTSHQWWWWRKRGVSAWKRAEIKPLVYKFSPFAPPSPPPKKKGWASHEAGQHTYLSLYLHRLTLSRKSRLQAEYTPHRRGGGISKK